MILFNREIKAERWPWQDGYNWRGIGGPRAPLNPNGARFGGGWRYKFGISIGATTIMIDLIWGMITIRPAKRKAKRA